MICVELKWKNVGRNILEVGRNILEGMIKKIEMDASSENNVEK